MRLFWIDTETRCAIDLPSVGTYRYVADDTFDVLLVSYAMGDDPVSSWWRYFAEPEQPNACEDIPDDLVAAWNDPDTMFVAHNAEFDMAVCRWLARRYGLPEIPVHRWFCTASYARAYNLPGALGRLTSEYLPREQRKKSELGRSLKWMWDAKQPLKPEDYPAMVQQVEYCEADVDSMRDVYRILPTPSIEFMQTLEAHLMINQRGVLVDEDMVAAAERLSPAVERENVEALHRLTGGLVKPRGPSLRAFLEAILPDGLKSLLTVTKKAREGYGWKSVKKVSTDKNVRAKLIEALDEWDAPIPLPDGLTVNDLRDIISVYEDANRSGGVKYLAMSDRIEDGFLRGSFALNGASQTGRFASYGVQVHNTVRQVPKNALKLMHILRMENLNPAVVTSALGMSINTALSQTVRPSLIAPEGDVLIWGDWSGIEARTLPWLSGRRSAQRVLTAFRNGEDLYVQEAAGIFGVAPDLIDGLKRQAGKVAVLACGFGGGVGAYQAMARNYRLDISDTQAADIVKGWRRNNKWAVAFWKGLEETALDAIRNPRIPRTCGKVEMIYVPGLLRGALLVWLPSGRYLCYPEAKIAMVEKFGSERPTMVFRHPTYGMIDTYGGRLAENVTQAEAASLLRRALYRLRDATVLHVHDEIVIESRNDPESVQRACQRLHDVMLDAPAWAEGLPLDVEIGYGDRYKIGQDWKPTIKGVTHD